MPTSKTSTTLRGHSLISHPRLNKGTAFTRSERSTFQLESLLPYNVQTLDEQCQRAWKQYGDLETPLQRNTFLSSLREQSWSLFYTLCSRHLTEVMPVLYTPTEGKAISNYSQIFRKPEGVFLAYPNRSEMENQLLRHAQMDNRSLDDIDLIIVSDGEQILGIGDQGVGGVAIAVAKGVVYTLSAGIDPYRILAVGLDVGTDNEELLNNELYVGWKHKRLRGQEYDDFVDSFVHIVKNKFPHSLLHFEDFGLTNARRLLQKYRSELSVFNDDVQGTGAVTLACIIAALNLTNTNLKDQRIVCYGAGSAGLGIAQQIRQEMIQSGLTPSEATQRFWLVDKPGLLNSANSDTQSEGQREFARQSEEKEGLLEVIRSATPTILIGTSTHAGAFSKEVIQEMSKHCDRPIVLPLSNPTELCECKPQNAFEWSKGKAIIATGSPFGPVELNGSKMEVAECNNAEIYPGLTLGTIISKAEVLSDEMISAGIHALAEMSPSKDDPCKALLPDFEEARKISARVAAAVALKAVEMGTAKAEGLPSGKKAMIRYIEEKMWDTRYVDLEAK